MRFEKFSLTLVLGRKKINQKFNTFTFLARRRKKCQLIGFHTSKYSVNELTLKDSFAKNSGIYREIESYLLRTTDLERRLLTFYANLVFMFKYKVNLITDCNTLLLYCTQTLC